MIAWLQQHTDDSKSDEHVAQCKKCIDSLMPTISAQYHELLLKRQALMLKLRDCIEKITIVQQEQASHPLREWKIQQTEAQVGAPFDDKRLDKIQETFEWLAELTWSVRSAAILFQMNLPLPSNVQDTSVAVLETNVSVLVNTLNQLIGFLVTESFIVSKQPPPVVKKKTNFTTEVRLLLGTQLGIGLSLHEVTVSLFIISEDQARKLKLNQIKVEEISKSPAGVILPLPVKKGKSNSCEHFGPSVNFQFEEPMYMLAKFKEIKLESILDEDRKFQRPPVKKPKASEAERDTATATTVTQKKYCFLFTSQFKVQDLTLKVWTLSLPVGVTVHGSQDGAAHATIFWDHAFSATEREPFQIRDPVPWPDFAKALNWKFCSLTGSERELSDQDLLYIAEKLFGRVQTDYSAEFVTWNRFFKSRATELLKLQPQASFLVRFSDSYCGAVSISFIPLNDAGLYDPNMEPLHLSPFSYQDLMQMSLPHRISSCPQLQAIHYLYPFGDKDQLLQKWCQASAEPEGSCRYGYAPQRLIMWIPGTTPASGNTFEALSPSPCPRSTSPEDAENTMDAMNALDNGDLDLNAFDLSNFNLDSIAIDPEMQMFSQAQQMDPVFAFRQNQTMGFESTSTLPLLNNVHFYSNSSN